MQVFNVQAAGVALEILHRVSHYRIEVPEMAYTMEDFERDTRRMYVENLHKLPPEDIQVILKEFPPETLLRGLNLEERLRGLDAEERLRGLDPAVVEAWLKRPRH